MVKKQFTLKEINTHIKDERDAYNDYKKDGLPKFSRDEGKHLKYWLTQKKKHR